MRYGLIGVVFAFAGVGTAAEPAATVTRILTSNCGRCHGGGGTVEGGLNYVADLPRLIARGKIVPGKPDTSPIVRRMTNGSMPPADAHPRPTDAEVRAVRDWVAAGADVGGSPDPRTFTTMADVERIVLADLAKFDRRGRRFQRYFDLTHLANAGLADGELRTHRNALAKLVNSLSWHPEVRVPEAVDAAGTILRIDLRWYLWDAALWNQILDVYPYGVQRDTAAARAVMVGTGSRMPVVRADWFVATASRAPLYYDVLQLPGNLAELERELRIDADKNIRQDRVMRVAFNGSGISRSNRILERHPSVHGAYWRTYDFEQPDENLIERGSLLPDRRNVFAHPLGPGIVAEPFQHAGGEAIFTLPNGLHGYYLVNAVNDRLDKAPQAIVTDPGRPDRSVEAGVSCIGCHITGILPKADQVRDHLDDNPLSFSRTDAELIRALYPPKDVSTARMAADAKAYTSALSETGNVVSKTEPVSTLTRYYEADLDLTLAAAEAGVDPAEFRELIAASDSLTRNLGALRTVGGTVARQVWVQTFGDIVRESRLGVLFRANVTAGQTADATADLDPLEQAGAVANAIAYSPDGRRALVAAADRSVRLWDVEGNRPLKILVGHTGSVWAAAFSADGTRGISGGMDGTARVWDLFTGTERLRLDGHTTLVTAVAFSADGTRAVSGGYDGDVVWWDVSGSGPRGRELRRLDADIEYVHAVDVHPVRPRVAIAADRDVILWDAKAGEVVRRWTAHDTATTSVRYFEAGKLLVTGGDDHRVKVWDADSGALLAELVGHEGSVRGFDLSAGGRWLVTASADRTVRLWDLTTKAEVAAFRRHEASVLTAKFLPSGVRTVSGDRALTSRIWDVANFIDGQPDQPAVRTGPPDTIPAAK